MKIVLACLVVAVLLSSFVIGYYVLFDYDFSGTYTSAVCSGNVCRDYIFTCGGGKIIDSRAISGFVTFDDDWTDKRENKEKC